MNPESQEDSYFYYDQSQVEITYEKEEQLHVILISISGELVNRRLFFSLEDAQNCFHNLELALHLGARFNEDGYWRFNEPEVEKNRLEMEYFKKAKGSLHGMMVNE